MPYLVDVFIGAAIWSAISVITAIILCTVITMLKKGAR
jgi:hypothetical protein